ncbi:unnamed protein product [Rotaria socialis]|uniref:Uncharacterized protein n=2 Tax=Rotaria socialis TaxID=392032 RepID=A0A821BFM5_9BILA|nr:unnamed protein product [Rotaria socialis]CAF4590168.1 unnamed protein product [Rotaria socialis]CAF4673251.1 unnamed protein product [Rotaria socialis]CAF4892007.1 unnamed protein product [Rotaria socialis]CAF4910229.1 unnamed protein product [Rotaria socialis]
MKMAKYVMYLLDALQFTVIMLMQVTNGQELVEYYFYHHIKKRHGERLLTGIYNDLRKDSHTQNIIGFDTYRGVQSPDSTLQALTTDPEKREKYLVIQYEYVLEHYENILRAFDKYQDRLYN